MNIKQRVPLFLSYSRIFLSPFLIWLLVHDYWLTGIFIFTLAVATDWIDGFWARRFNSVSSHGAYIDPLADKIMLLGTLGTFVFLKSLPLLFFVVIAFREIGITTLRSWCEMKGKRFVTAWHGKYKTVLQIMLIYSLFAYHLDLISHDVVYGMGFLVALYSVVSGLVYCHSTFKKV